jgi:hypothetical protein
LPIFLGLFGVFNAKPLILVRKVSLEVGGEAHFTQDISDKSW